MFGPMRRSYFAGVFAVAAAVGIAGAPGRAAAAESLMSPNCGTENLLAGKLPWAHQDTRGNLYFPTDGAVAPEGAQWDAPVGVTFDTAAGSLTYDLGQPMPVSAFVVQADANDSYKIFGSLDGSAGSFKMLGEIPDVLASAGHGLRTRSLNLSPTVVRYLRIGEPLGDNFYSVSELQAFCQPPTPFPPRMRVVDAPQARVVQLPWWKFAWWENDASSREEMALALLALGLVGWGTYLVRKGTPSLHQKLRDWLLVAVGVLSFCSYWNFFSFHFGNYVHIWDTFHYYIGSKYFKELSYDRLYECVAVADSEDPSVRRRVELRKIMDLRTNMMHGTQEILAHPERCKQHFSPERWQAFKGDVAYFRVNHGVKRWEDAQADHGYNATPVWTILGTTLSNTGPATQDQIWWLTHIDPLFIIGITLMTWWAFGWRVTCVALAVFATNFPSRFYWTGGAFLRWDWLFYLVGGICLVRKKHPLLGGFFLGYSTLLRVFPGFLFLGPLLAVVHQVWGTRTTIEGPSEGPSDPRPTRLPWWKPEPFPSLGALWARIDRRFLALFGGLALSIALFVPLSLVTSNGIEGYRAFIRNTEKHKETPLTNYMGLRTVVVYRPSEAGRVLRTDRLEDPWGIWKQTKLRTFEKSKFVYYILVAGFVYLLFHAVRGVEPWMACSLGAMMIAVGVELTCYYYSFLFAVALLYEKRRDIGAWLLAVTATTGFIDWAPTRYLPSSPFWDKLHMPQWIDEQYMWMSVATLAAFAYVLYRLGFKAPEPELAVEGAAPGTTATSTTSANVSDDAGAENKWWGLGKSSGSKSGK
jgi:hypothetical protein